MRSLTQIGVVLVLIVTACTSDGSAPTTTPTTAVTTTAATTAPTSTTLAHRDIPIAAVGDVDAGAIDALRTLYSWLADRLAPAPDMPDGLADHIVDHTIDDPGPLVVELHTAAARHMGLVGVAMVEDRDVVLLVNDDHPRGGDTGWRVVGGWFDGLDPWFGETIRRVMIIGTDAREWQDPIRFRGDSLHIVTANAELGGGGVLGFPRDSWVEAPYGTDKFTHINAITWTNSDKQVDEALETVPDDPYLTGVARWLGFDAVMEMLRNGPDGGQVTTDVAEDLTGLEIEGYLLTGFRDFQLLFNDYGSIMIDVPFAMADAASQAYFEAGLQEMWGRYALAFSRNRHLTGGDFTRSFHQGMVIQARLDRVLEGDFTQLPHLIGALVKHTWTDLSLEQLLTLGATAYLMDPENVGNAVVPGSVTTRGGASVVVLSERAELYYRDLDDGVLDLEFLDEE